MLKSLSQKEVVRSLQKSFEQEKEDDEFLSINNQDGSFTGVQKREPNNVNSSISIVFGGAHDKGRKKDLPNIQSSMWSYTLNSKFYNFQSPWNPKPNETLEKPYEEDDQWYNNPFDILIDRYIEIDDDTIFQSDKTEKDDDRYRYILANYKFIEAQNLPLL